MKSTTLQRKTGLRAMSEKKKAKLAAEGHASPRSTIRSSLRSSPSPSKPRGTKQGMARRKTLSPRNAKRREREFARCYGSKERVEWVKSLPCVGCVAYWPIEPSPGWLSENAHTVTGGKGRKADANTIVPLCPSHHRQYDQHRAPFDHPELREQMRHLATHVEAAWQAESARRARTGETG